MPPQTHQDQPGSDAAPGAAQPVTPLSRRSMLRGAAGAGAVGLAVAAGAGTAFAATRPGALARPAEAGKAVTADAAAEKTSGEPIVVYVRDTAAGDYEVFHGTRQIRGRNPGLVAQLVDGLHTA